MVQRKKKNQKRKGEQDYEKDDGNENEQGDGSKGSKTDLAAVVMTASMTMTVFAGTAGTTTTLPKESYQNDMNREAEAAYMDAMRTRWTADQLKTVYPIDINQDGVLEYVVQTATKDEDYIWEDICTYVMSFNGMLQVNEIDDRLSRYPMIEIAHSRGKENGSGKPDRSP